jgi:hypothetical protein
MHFKVMKRDGKLEKVKLLNAPTFSDLLLGGRIEKYAKN